MTAFERIIEAQELSLPHPQLRVSTDNHPCIPSKNLQQHCSFHLLDGPRPALIQGVHVD